MVYVTCQRDERKRLDAAKEQLGSIKYHPLRDYTSPIGRVDECGIKRKKLKKDNINCKALTSFFVSTSPRVLVCKLNYFSFGKLKIFFFLFVMHN